MNIMPPIPARHDQELPPGQDRFNERQVATRQVVERTFTMLKNRWRRLGTLENRLYNVNHAILACCVLHNMCIRNGDISATTMPDGLFGPVDLNHATAAEKREAIVQFMSQ